MAVNACDICGCIPVSMDDRFFYQAAINLLCDISTNTAGGGGGGGDVNLTQVGGVAIALGQAAMAASLPVVLASNQTAIPVTTVIPGTAATNLGKAEDQASASGDVGVASLFIYRNSATGRVDANDDYINPAANRYGAQYVDLNVLYQGDATAGNSPIRLEDTPVSEGEALMMAGARRIDTPAANPGASGDAGFINQNVEGYLYVDTVRRNTMTHTQPTVTNATSFTLAAAATQRKYLLVQNNSAANIMINLNNGTLTGIIPTSTNLGIVIIAGASYETPANFCPTAAVTCYQTSGGSINTVSVIEGV